MFFVWRFIGRLKAIALLVLLLCFQVKTVESASLQKPLDQSPRGEAMGGVATQGALSLKDRVFSLLSSKNEKQWRVFLQKTKKKQSRWKSCKKDIHRSDVFLKSCYGLPVKTKKLWKAFLKQECLKRAKKLSYDQISETLNKVKGLSLSCVSALKAQKSEWRYFLLEKQPEQLFPFLQK